ncbi:MAG: hypothetical protein BWY19_01191 [bacterium ADurb.Bin212]|nr:MAG: hypothetical protein BWY19_01191 [bacterium ADurb.Bin212]
MFKMFKKLKIKKLFRISIFEFRAFKLIAVMLLIAIPIAYTGIFLFSKYQPIPSAHAAWYAPDWDYRQQITIDHTKVANTDQTDFPVLIKITDENNPIFDNTQADGDDILFTGSDETTKLSHEIETLDATSHQFWAWVKVPSLSHDSNTILYMYYGNSSATNQQNASGVWSNGYVGVWHLNEIGTGSAGDYKDSTSNANNSTNTTDQPTATEGKINGGESFNGTTKYIDILKDSSLDITEAPLSVFAWIKPAVGAGSGYPFEINTSSAGDRQYGFYWSNNNNIVPTVPGDVAQSSIPSVPTNSFSLVGFVWSASKNVQSYVNGAASGSSASNGRYPVN